VRQNLFFAFAYNSAGVPIAAGALYPALGWLVSTEFAAAAKQNALRLVPLKAGWNQERASCVTIACSTSALGPQRWATG